MSDRQPSGYRPDIDGLRAFAVLSVVGYHVVPPLARGGFVGVDVFFVISGYLVCGIILNDLREGTFRFRDFYSRRIRRLFPALILVLSATLLFGPLVLFPDEYRSLGRHVLGGAAFLSHFFLWEETGYFDRAASAKPLLHLWSLGIEEQFYLAFPLLLWGCAKKGWRAGAVLPALCLLSFAYNLHVMKDPARDFYSPLARAWEPLAGAALRAAMPLPAAGGTARRLAWAGCILLALSLAPGFVLYGEKIVWPGWQALLPVAGALSLLAAGPENPLSKRLLANPLAVFLGRVSYPFYLWHWPLVSFATIMCGILDARTRMLRLGLVGLSLVLAVLTHCCVEKPIRFGPRARNTTACALVAVMALVGGAGVSVSRTKTAGYDNPVARYEVVSDYDQACRAYTGLSRDEFADFDLSCRFSGGHGPATVALIGNSHALSAYFGLEKQNAALGLNTLLLARSEIPLLWGSEALITDDNELKNRYRDLVRRSFDVLERKEIHSVFIAAYLDMETDVPLHLQPTIDRLARAGKKVFLIVDWPALPRSALTYVDRPFREFLDSMMPRSRGRELARERLLETRQEYLEMARSLHNVTVIDGTWDAFCPGRDCLVFSETGRLLYYDDHHLTNAGSDFLSEKVLKPYLEELAGGMCLPSVH